LNAPSLDFGHSYELFLFPIRAKCKRLLGCSPAAEDVAQEVFLRLWRSGIEGDPRTVMAWLYRTCTRLSLNVLRDNRRVDAGGLIPDDGACGIDVVACAEARATIASLTAVVPDQELEAVVLVRVDGLSQPEAATLLGVSERTVRRSLARFDERTVPLREERSR
jgi:RNA polymerase sigma-70 factor, ECF subfamily